MIDNWTINEFMDAYKRTYIPGSKTAVLYKKEWLYSMVVLRINKIDPPKLLKDRYMLETIGFAMEPHNFLFDVFNRKLQHYIEADLINYNAMVRAGIYDDPKKYAENKDPFAVLTLKELEAGFVVCIVPFILSIFVFGLEWLRTVLYLAANLFVLNEYFLMRYSEQKRLSEITKVKIAAWQEGIKLSSNINR